MEQLLPPHQKGLIDPHDLLTTLRLRPAGGLELSAEPRYFAVTM